MTHDHFPNNSPQPNFPPPQHAIQTGAQNATQSSQADAQTTGLQSSSADLAFEFDFERAEAADEMTDEAVDKAADEMTTVEPCVVELDAIEFDFERADAAELDPFEVESLNEIDDLDTIHNLDKPIDFNAYRMDAQVEAEELALNAYLDGELTDAVRQRVEMLLHADASHRQRYNQLARLSREFKRLPVPPSSVTAEELADRAIAVAQERRRRSFTWGTSAVAALFLTVLSSTGSLRSNFYAPNVAQTPTPRFQSEELQAQPNAVPRVSQNVADRAVNSPTNNHSPLVSRALFVE